MMKTIKILLAVTIFLCTATTAQAAMYWVNVKQLGMEVDSPKYAPTGVLQSWDPRASGAWHLSTSAFDSATIDFIPHSFRLTVLGSPYASGLIIYDDAVYNIVGGNFAYDPGTLTLTLSNATATYSGVAPSCTGSQWICNYLPTPDLDRVDVILTFLDASLSAFTGSIKAYNTVVNTTDLLGGTLVYDWQLTGQEVPLPAAAWLFGSGLIGMAGLVRRRAAAQKI